jgi:hypothetical protein
MSMRRLRSHLSASILWIVALWLAALAVGFFGVQLGLAAAAGLAVLALAASLFVTIRAERLLKRRLADLVGATSADSVENAIAKLVRRLDQVSQYRDALTALRYPVLFADSAGVTIAASEGLRRIVPEATEGTPIARLFGEDLPAQDGEGERQIATIGGKRYDLIRGKTPGGRMIIEFAPDGEFVADDEIDAFRTAVNEGQTQLRFDGEAAARSQVILAFNEAIHALDEAAYVADKLAAGRPLEASGDLSSALAPRLRTLSAHHVAIMQLLLEANRDRRRLTQEAEQAGRTSVYDYPRGPRQPELAVADETDVVVPMRAAGGRG